MLQTLPLTIPDTVGPEAIAFGDGSLWVTTTGYDDSDNPLPGSLERVNPATGQQQATIPIGRGAVDVEVSPGAVWVTAYEDNAVLRIDPATNTVAATIPVPGSPLGVAFGAGSLWVSSMNGKVARIDPATNSIVATIATQDDRRLRRLRRRRRLGDERGHGGPTARSRGSIRRPTRVTASVTVGSWPWRLAYAGGSVWIGMSDAPTVVRVSATTNAVLNRVTVDDDVRSIAATDHAVWAGPPRPEARRRDADRLLIIGNAAPGSAPRLTDRQGQRATGGTRLGRTWRLLASGASAAGSTLAGCTLSGLDG